MWGGRTAKGEALWAGTPAGLSVTPLPHKEPLYALVPRDYGLEEAYNRGFRVTDLMPQNQIGFQSHRDAFAVAFERDDIEKRLAHLRNLNLTEHDLAKEYGFQLSPHWNLAAYRRDPARRHEAASRISECDYRPFDRRWCLLDEMAMDRPRWPLMRSSATGQSFALNVVRQTKMSDWRHGIVSEFPAPAVFAEIKDGSNFLPLYIVEQIDGSVRLNFDPKLYAAICKAAGIDPADQAGPDDDFRAITGEARPSEVKVFDYIYGVLHSPAYRETFAEFLKIDFPRIPYPPSPEVFRHISEKGEQLRRLHLMEPAAIGETPYPYHGEGDDVVASGYPKWERSSLSRSDGEGDHAKHDGGAGAGSAAGAAAPPSPAGADATSPSGFAGQGGFVGRVHINEDQYFDGVPEVAWQFHIGGYQPAQKWLKDRRGRALSYDDITHYQKIVKILSETDRMMREIQLPLET